MKEFNKEEYNKLCAEFLEWKEDFAHELDRHGYVQTIDGYKTPFLNIAGHESNRSMLIHSIAQLKFDSDWNWIMEVVEKIETLIDGFVLFRIEDEGCFVAAMGVQNYNNYTTMATKKEAVIQAIWDFLNWHKENKS